MSAVPSPCVDICKFGLKADGERRCLGCGMTKPQKKAFKKLGKRKARARFLSELVAQQAALAPSFKAWRKLYGRKLERRGLSPEEVGASL